MKATEELHAVALADLAGSESARATLNEGAVARCAAAIKRGEVIAPLVVFEDGKRLWLADGFHRTAAARAAGLDRLSACLREGGRRDALLYAIRQLREPGVRRTRADKRRAVELLLADPEWSAKSNRWIAAQAGVSNGAVQQLRHRRRGGGDHDAEPSRRLGLDGRFRRARNSTGHHDQLKRDEAAGEATRFGSLSEYGVPESQVGRPPFGVIVLDPPWSEVALDVAALPVASLAESDSILWFWAPAEHLGRALAAVATWGFTCRTVLVWAKDETERGEVLLEQTELCLVATRGKPCLLCTVQTTLLRAPAEAGKRPRLFFERIQGLCPGTSKLEMFSRSCLRGWTMWSPTHSKREVS